MLQPKRFALILFFVTLLPSSLLFVSSFTGAHHRPSTPSKTKKKKKTTTTTTTTTTTSLRASCSRRGFCDRAFLIGSTALLVPQSSSAGEKEDLTRENADEAWAVLEFERDDPKGGVAYMQKLIDERDFDRLLEFTKGYDIDLRKEKIGRCKRFLNSAERAIATLSGNAITFDLIGINRRARPGVEDAEGANGYLDELRTDLQNVINQKKEIEWEAIEAARVLRDL